MKVCIVIPAFNEERTIGTLVRQVRAGGHDVTVADDGSSDATVSQARCAGAEVLVSAVNRGKGAALARGFAHCLRRGYDAAITMDGDGQHAPEDVPFFVRAAQAPHTDILVGNRMHDSGTMPLVRYCTNMFMSWLISLLAGQQIPDTQCGFRLIKRRVLESISLRSSKFEVESEMLVKAARAGFSIVSVPVTTIYSGEDSSIRPFRDTLRFIRFFFKALWTTPY